MSHANHVCIITSHDARGDVRHLSRAYGQEWSYKCKCVRMRNRIGECAMEDRASAGRAIIGCSYCAARRRRISFNSLAIKNASSMAWLAFKRGSQWVR